VSGSADGVVKVWNLKKNVCVSSFEMHEDRVWGLEVDEHHNDKLRLLTGGADSTIKVWLDDTVE